MTDSNVRDLPVEIDFDLDAYERPAEEIIPDFKIKLGGRVIVMTNPDEIDWKDLLDITDPVAFLRHSVSVDDRSFILGLDLPSHKFGKLMDSYYAHFHIEERMEKAKQAERLRGR